MAITPGPWFAANQGAPTVRRADGSVICGVPSNYGDATLIALSPEIAAALVAIVEAYREPQADSVFDAMERTSALVLVEKLKGIL